MSAAAVLPMLPSPVSPAFPTILSSPQVAMMLNSPQPAMMPSSPQPAMRPLPAMVLSTSQPAAMHCTELFFRPTLAPTPPSREQLYAQPLDESFSLPMHAPIPTAMNSDGQKGLFLGHGSEVPNEAPVTTVTADPPPPKDEHPVLLAFAERYTAEHDAATYNDDMSGILSMVYHNEYRRLEQQADADEDAKLAAKNKAVALARKALGSPANGYNGTSAPAGGRFDTTPPLDKVALYLTVSALPSGLVSDFDATIIDAWAMLKDMEPRDKVSIASYFNAHFPFLSLQTARIALSSRPEDVYMSLYHAIIVTNSCSHRPAAGARDSQHRLRFFLHRYLAEFEALRTGDKAPSRDMAAALGPATEFLRTLCMMAARFDDEHVLDLFWGLYGQYREFIVHDRTPALFEDKVLGWLKGKVGPLRLVWSEPQ